jgi:hypothetical protein
MRLVIQYSLAKIMGKRSLKISLFVLQFYAEHKVEETPTS